MKPILMSLAAVLLAAASLFAQTFASTAADGQGSARGDLSESPAVSAAGSAAKTRDAARARKVKDQILLSRSVRLTLRDGERLEGMVGRISNEEFTILSPRTLRKPASSQTTSGLPAATYGARHIRFDEVKRVTSLGGGISDPGPAFGVGFTCGLLLPVVLILMPLMLTGLVRD